MLIGLTYDLRAEYLVRGYGLEETAEFDRPETIEALETTLMELGHSTERIGNIERLVEQLAGGARWDLVFNIAEGLHGYGREAQVPALLDAYRIPYTFSDPLTMSVCLNKAVAKRILLTYGIPTPAFHLVEREDDVDAVNLPLPLFAKPVAGGTGIGVTARSLIRHRRDLRTVCRRLLRHYHQPVLVERLLPGREFTVGILGTGPEARVAGLIEIVLLEGADALVYSYDNKEYCEERVEYRLVADDIGEQVAAIALESWRALDGLDAGRIDIRLDADGVPMVMELNPLPGLHPEHSDLPILCSMAGMRYSELIEAIVESAQLRAPRQAGKARRRVSAPIRAVGARPVAMPGSVGSDLGEVLVRDSLSAGREQDTLEITGARRPRA
jgi:D-alanine-D-alanine ligase